MHLSDKVRGARFHRVINNFWQRDLDLEYGRKQLQKKDLVLFWKRTTCPAFPQTWAGVLLAPSRPPCNSYAPSAILTRFERRWRSSAGRASDL
jgi:hypothetical protein